VFIAVECGYPPVKDDVIVKGSDFTYSSEGVLFRCRCSNNGQRRQKPVQIQCLSNSSWSVKDFSCSGRCRLDLCIKLFGDCIIRVYCL